MSSAVEEETSTSLSPEFQAAMDVAQNKLQEAIPEAYHDKMLPLLSHFVTEYLTASQAAAADGKEMSTPDLAAQRILTAVEQGLMHGIADPFKFESSHVALRGDQDFNDVDYYEFGCDFFRSVMKAPATVLGQDNLDQLVKQLEAGENVVFLANHQSEADPQVVSVCLEEVGHDELAQKCIYVAGHKVTTDPLAIPFSMGRNLICIHSKKHINADTETKGAKQRDNLKAMGAMLNSLKKGGTLLWVAPSGGRDRRNVETGEVPLAPFDSKTIDMFRLMGNKSKVPTHFYTLAMSSYELCPPPDSVEAGVGEQRNVRYVPIGIAVGEELESTGGLEGRHKFCETAFQQCEADYEALLQAMKEDK